MLPTKHLHAVLLIAGLSGMAIPGCATSLFDAAMLKTAALKPAIMEGHVAENRAERSIFLRHPGRLAHAAPLRNSTTFTVSNTIVRSKITDRCLM